MRPGDGGMSTALSLVLALIVGLSPMWLGSNRPLVWAIHASLFGALLVLIAAALVLEWRRAPELHLARLAAPLLMVLTGLAWAVVQVVPGDGLLPVHPAWGVASDTLDQPLAATISINPTETFWAVLKWLTAGIVLVASYSLSRNASNANLLLRTLLLVACCVGLYGLFRLSFSFDKILWFEERDTGYLTSGFINRNSAATFFAMMSLAALGLLITRVRRLFDQTRGVSGRERTTIWSGAFSGWFGIELVIFVLLFVCLLATGSRGGFLAAGFGVLVLLLLYGLRGRNRASRSTGNAGWVLAFLLSGILVLGVSEVAGFRVMSRLMSDGLESAGRLDTYKQTLLAISDYLWLGSGLGTFQDVFPAYRLEIAPGRHVWDKAHNDYLELILGLGLVGAALVLTGLAGLILTCLKGFFARRRDAHYAAIAVSASVLVVLHSFVDFSLQIQANTLAYATLLGLGLAQSISSRG
jgi:O-antigen ligase